MRNVSFDAESKSTPSDQQRKGPHHAAADRIEVAPSGGLDQQATGEFAEGRQHCLSAFCHEAGQPQTVPSGPLQPANGMQMARQHEVGAMRLGAMAASKGSKQPRLADDRDAE